MATITTDAFLDTATGTRTAGETWTMNGCTLTVRTDTRWYQGAPASMTGSLGAVSVSTALGGSFVVDATNVRWLAYTSGTGNVPAIGTTITRGGVSGTLLGVWSSYTSAPTDVGSAMPVTGWIKFREVTGGTFTAGALTGIGATASGPDVVGWIEVCNDAGSSMTGNELGGGIQFKGSWFELGTTTGVRGQTLQVPTNGGGSGTHVFGVEIETAPGSGVYEWYPAASSTLGASLWTTANLTSDLRAKFVESMGNGAIRIGSDGTNDIGYLPPSGCKVRIPNIFGRTVATTSRASNQVPGAVTRATLAGLNYKIENLHCDYSLTGVNAAVVQLKNTVMEQLLTLTNLRDQLVIDNLCMGGFTAPASASTWTTLNGGTIKKLKAVNSGSILGVLRLVNVSGLNFETTEVIVAKSRTATVAGLVLSSADTCTFQGIKTKGGNIALTIASNCSLKSIDYVDRMEGATNTANQLAAIQITGCSNLIFDGFSFGEGGQLLNTHCYGNVLASATNASSNIKFRNAGSRNAPLDVGTTSTTWPAFFMGFQTGDSNFKFQRCYINGVRGSSGAFAFAYPSSMVGLVLEDVMFGGYSLSNPTPNGRTPIFRKIYSAPSSTVGTSLPQANAGLHWMDHFTSDTTGVIRWFAAAPSSETSSLNYIVASQNQGTGYIGTTASISLDTAGDYAFSESAWQFKGHTGFSGAPTLTGTTTGLNILYDIDNGAGFSGVWKSATAQNLTAEVVSPTGFKMRVRVEANGSQGSASNIQTISFPTTTTVADQAANLYDLETVSLTLTGLKPGTEVRAYVGTDPLNAVEISGVEETASNSFTFAHSAAGQTGFIRIFALGYQPIYFDPYVYPSTDTTILVQQVVDRNYSNPA